MGGPRLLELSREAEVPGVLLLLGSGTLAIDEKFRYGRAVAFGVGSVLVLDEALLLIDLNAEDYWKAGNLAALAGGVVLLGANVVIAPRYYARVAQLAVGHAFQTLRNISIARQERAYRSLRSRE